MGKGSTDIKGCANGSETYKKIPEFKMQTKSTPIYQILL